MSATDACARCGGDCPMTDCPECGGCENTGEQPCPACQPSAPDAEMRPCEICADGPTEECGTCEGSGYDDFSADGRCVDCGGVGAFTPEHCCACGGSPYCTCCRTCGASCIAACRCPVTVRRADGSTMTLGGAA